MLSLEVNLEMFRWGSWFGSSAVERHRNPVGDWAGCRPPRWGVFSSPEPAHSKAVSLSSWSNRGQTVELVLGRGEQRRVGYPFLGSFKVKGAVSIFTLNLS